MSSSSAAASATTSLFTVHRLPGDGRAARVPLSAEREAGPERVARVEHEAVLARAVGAAGHLRDPCGAAVERHGRGGADGEHAADDRLVVQGPAGGEAP